MFNQTQAFREYLRRRENALSSNKSQEMQPSNLFNEKTFYRAFTKDLLTAKKEVIIYSPFVTKFRADYYKSILEKLRRRNIEVFIFTRPLDEYETIFKPQIEQLLKDFEKLGVCVFFLSKHIHEKVAIIDREILWEGSLNILSHRASSEMMRRTKHHDYAMQAITCLNLNKRLVEGYKYKYEKMYRSLIDVITYEKRAKIRLFLFGLSVPLIIWCLFAFIKVILPILKIYSLFIS